MVAAAVHAAGARAGLFTSPHLVDVRERFQVAGQPIPAGAFAAWVARLRPVIETTGASFFEATTAIAMADFAARHVDVAVVEVGLGGRLDSTNALAPAMTAVTNVSLDHTDYLGTDPAAIAREKAGIAKPGVPMVIGEPDPSLVAVLRAEVERRGGVAVVVDPDLRYGGPLGTAGFHQRRNAAIARTILEAMPGLPPLPGDAVRSGLATVRVPGRFERRGRWILDVAHNPAGVEALVATLEAEAPARPLHAVFAALADKDRPRMVRLLSRVVDRIWVSVPPSAPPDRGVPPAALETGPGLVSEPEFHRALDEAQRDAGTVLVTGSFHTVGAAMVRLPGFRPFG